MTGKMIRRWAFAVLTAATMVGCGTFQLGTVRPQPGRSADQQQLDTLTCKDQAELAIQKGSRQAGDFLLGMTVVGAPVAYSLDKAKARQVFADCMRARGYSVARADGTDSQADANAPPSPPVPGADKLVFALPIGFVLQPVAPQFEANGVLFYATSRTLDIGTMLSAERHEGITDLIQYARTKRASQIGRISSPSFTDLVSTEIGGFKAVRYTVTGTVNRFKLTYVTTILEGHDQIIIVDAWTGAANAEQRMAELESLAAVVSGIS